MPKLPQKIKTVLRFDIGCQSVQFDVSYATAQQIEIVKSSVARCFQTVKETLCIFDEDEEDC